MAEKVPTSAQKVGQAKPHARNKPNKGDSVVCEVCGLSLVIEQLGGIAVAEETALFCCGEPMKTRKISEKARAGKSPTPRKTSGKARKAGPVKTVSGWPLVQAAGSSGVPADPKEDVNQQ
jgi:hypothetical protein